MCSLCHGLQHGSTKHPQRSIVLPKFGQHQMQMCKEIRDEEEDFGLTGVISRVRTFNVLIVSIFA